MARTLKEIHEDINKVLQELQDLNEKQKPLANRLMRLDTELLEAIPKCPCEQLSTLSDFVIQGDE